MTLRPLSPIRHTYTGAEGRSESATSESALEEDAAWCLRRGPLVFAAVLVPRRVLVDVEEEPPPELSRPQTSNTISSATTPTTARYPLEGPPGERPPVLGRP